MINPQHDFEGFNLTINTTEDCNLRCKYCYETCKSPKTINIDTCKKFIDIILNDPDPCGVKGDSEHDWIYKKGVCLDFIGGDSFVNVDILDEICEYFIHQLYMIDNPHTRKWRGNYKFSISTNGTLFNDRVKEFLKKYKDSLYFSVSLDGCPEIHDRYRVFPDGRGSMSKILEYWPWLKENFPHCVEATKATASKETIPYLYDSLKFLHEDLDITYIMQNFIMEDMHLTPEDLLEFDRQMEKCLQYCLDHRHDIYWRMLDKSQFANAHLSTGNDWCHKGHCGSGSMPALSIDGNIYPCFRWLPHTQNGKVGVMKVGDVINGLNHKENFKVVREGAYRCNCTKDSKCRECQYESACSYCIGGCYAEFGDFTRTTYICEITKRTCEWAKKYWKEYDRLEGQVNLESHETV